MLIPSICSLIYKEDDLYSFLISGIVTFIVGLCAEQITKSGSKIDEFNRKDGGDFELHLLARNTAYCF